MRRRLLGTIVAVTTLALVLFGVPLAMLARSMVDETAVLRLERQAVLAARSVPPRRATADDIELPGSDGVDYAFYDPSGARVVGEGPSTADALTEQALANAIVDGEVGETFVVAVPIVGDEAVIGALRAQQATALIDRRAQQIFVLLAALAAGVVVVAAFVASVLAARITRPIGRLRDATVQLGTGDFAIDPPSSTIPELSQTAAALAATARRLDELITRERAFSADASHQLRTPLTGMRTMLEAELDFPRPDRRDALHEALSDIERLDATITELLTIARHATAPAQIDLAPILDQLAATWRPLFRASARALDINPGRYHPHPLGHAVMLRHTLDILLDNALTHGRGTTTIELTHTDDIVAFTVTDEGRGFPGGLQPDPTSNGNRSTVHGHGLPLARRLVSAMHGRLTVAEAGPSPRIEITLRRRSG